MKKSTLFLFVTFGISGCFGERPTPSLAIVPTEQASPVIFPPDQELQNLENFLKEKAYLKIYVEDVSFAVQAKIKEKSGQTEEALKLWQAALEKSPGPLLKEFITKNLAHQPSSLELEELTDAQTQEDSEQKNLTKTQNTPLLAEEDPLLLKAIKKACKDNTEEKKILWDKKGKELQHPLSDYWAALLAECRNEKQAAIQKLRATIPHLLKSKKTRPHALEALEVLAKLERGNDQRKEATKTYLALLHLWNDPTITAESLGVSPEENRLRKIDHHLWFARYSALMGDYEAAKNAITDTLKLIEETAPTIAARSNSKLAGMRAEAYFIQGFQVAIEEDDLETANTAFSNGLRIKDLPVTWQERFLWFRGLIAYMQDEHEDAINSWKTLLNKTSDSDTKARIYFWLARISKKLGDTESSQNYMSKLQQIFPFHYYTLHAPIEADLSSGLFQNQFAKPDELVRIMENTTSYRMSSMRENETTDTGFTKSEILINTELFEWAHITTQDLRSSVKEHFPLNERHLEGYLYLSRLLYASQNYKSAIQLTSSASLKQKNFWEKWPEQLLIYYPLAYSDLYKKYAQRERLPLALLYGISRQESLFDAHATSPMNARGLMQLIPVTAQRMAEQVKTSAKDNFQHETLYSPEVNVQLGARYLSELGHRYKGFLPAMAAAYNAGESVVDRWMLARHTDDPLLWIELITFGETRDYVRRVLGNMAVYQHIGSPQVKVTLAPKKAWKSDLHAQKDELPANQTRLPQSCLKC